MTHSNADRSHSAAPLVFSSTQEVAADIANELRKFPQRWTQGCSARRSDGSETEVHDSDAVCWSLDGHIIRRRAAFSFADFSAHFELSLVGLVFWNEADERTVADIIYLCERVARSRG
jgi:hypothetical protein